MFVQWVEHFQKYVKVYKEDPVILFIDNYSKHFMLEAYTFFKENGIIVFTVLPHTLINCNH